MKINGKYAIIFLLLIISLMSAADATNTDNLNSTDYAPQITQNNPNHASENAITTDKQMIKGKNDNAKTAINTISQTDESDSTIELVDKSNYLDNDNSQLKTEPKTEDQSESIALIITPETFDYYITNGELNSNVENGSTLDFRGKFDGERYEFSVNKPVNIISSTYDAFLCFYSTQKTEGTYEIPNHSFLITKEGSGTNVTGITFEETMIVTKEAHDVTFDNLTVYCNSGYGWGLGSTSIRNSENVTIKNSYFETHEETVWSSTVVFAASRCCLIENCTVIGVGFVGNLVYATTYNVNVYDEYGNSNITIRSNTIIGRNITPGLQTCYSVCLIGDNLTVENNYIENLNGYLIMSQYHDNVYSADGRFGKLVIRNNSLGPGKIGVEFNQCTISNNTFYGKVKLDVLNNTIQENNTEKDANENPYLIEKESIFHPTIVNITAPASYIYDENSTFSVTVTDLKDNKKITEGYLEVYSDGTLFKNITITNQTTTFTYHNPEIGEHHVRVWYYPTNTNILGSQKVHTINSEKIRGQLILETKSNPEIGEKVTLKVSYTLNKNVSHKTNITFTLPGQDPITLEAKNNLATLETTITTDYIKNILGGREQSIKLTATTNDTNIEITGMNKKLGVQKAVTQIMLTPNETKVLETTTFITTITTNSDLMISAGKIVFTDQDGNNLGEKKVYNNTVKLTLTFNETGIQKITATYDGTIHFNASQKTTNIDIQKHTTTLTINQINDTQYTNNSTITGTLKTTNGTSINSATLTINVNGEDFTTSTDRNGIFTYDYKTSMIGTNNVTVSYPGSTQYANASAKATFAVVQQSTRIIINNIEEITYGEKVTISGTVMDLHGNKMVKTGLQVSINNKTVNVKTDNNGIFTVTSSSTYPGTNNVTAIYEGNVYYALSTAEATFTVNKKDTKITINHIASVEYGKTVTITGTFMDTTGYKFPNTSIHATLNGKTFDIKTNPNGIFSLTTKTKTPGTGNITVFYNGSTYYNSCSTNATYNILAKTTRININPIANVEYGKTVTITGKFTDGTGNIFKNTRIQATLNGKTFDIKTNENGVFTITAKTKAPGVGNITVFFNGNNYYQTSSTKATYNITAKITKITINKIASVEYADTVTITGKFTDGDGNILKRTGIQATINGKTFNVKTDDNGTFTIVSKASTLGTSNVTVFFNGNNYYQASSAKTTFNVTSITTKITINNMGNVKYNTTATITGKFTDKNSNAMKNSALNVELNGKTFNVKTDTSGAFKITSKANTVGTKNITISYPGSTYYKASTTKKTYQVVK